MGVQGAEEDLQLPAQDADTDAEVAQVKTKKLGGSKALSHADKIAMLTHQINKLKAKQRQRPTLSYRDANRQARRPTTRQRQARQQGVGAEGGGTEVSSEARARPPTPLRPKRQRDERGSSSQNYT